MNPLRRILRMLPFCCVALGAGAVELHPPEVTLAKVRRIFVDQLGGGKESDQMRDMVIAALQNAGLFVITENPERADASLKGSGDDKTFTEQHNTSDSIGFHTGEASGTRSAVSLGASSSSNKSLSAGISENESSHIQERRHEATASVRLVAANGDVIWSTTQESNGAKFRGAMADVADKIARRLIDETRKARASAVALPADNPTVVPTAPPLTTPPSVFPDLQGPLVRTDRGTHVLPGRLRLAPSSLRSGSAA